MTPEEEEREQWWERIARALEEPIAATYQSDWMDAANCLVENVEDVSFIKEPDEFTDRRWARICSKCEVFRECLTWADRLDVHGVYIAGEWRA